MDKFFCFDVDVLCLVNDCDLQFICMSVKRVYSGLSMECFKNKLIVMEETIVLDLCDSQMAHTFHSDTS